MSINKYSYKTSVALFARVELAAYLYSKVAQFDTTAHLGVSPLLLLCSQSHNDASVEP